MKVGIPTMGDSGLDESVSQHFGRASTFTIVDTEADEVRVVPNSRSHRKGSSMPPEKLDQEGVQVMLCSDLGPKAINMFEQFGIEVFVGAEGKVRDALESWKAGKLEEATEKEACEEHRRQYSG